MKLNAWIAGAAVAGVMIGCGGVSSSPAPVKETMVPADTGVDPQWVTALFSDYAAPGGPGAAVMVLKDGDVAFARGFGLADVETGAAIGTRTCFRLASLTKAMTATAALLLVQDGKLTLDTKVTEVLLDFPAYGRAITVRHLLAHTSGLVEVEDSVPADAPRQILDKDVVAMLALQKGTEFEPGSKFAYSNSGYAMLAVMIEQVSGMAFAEFLRTRVFEPLGMSTAVAFEQGTSTIADRAFGHQRKDDRWVKADQSPTSAVLGDGGVYASLEDLRRWDAAIHDHTLLGAAQDSVFVSNRLTDGSPTGYGFGWFLDSLDGHVRQRHTGSSRGFRHAIQRFPDEHLTVIVLTNRDEGEPQTIGTAVARMYLR